MLGEGLRAGLAHLGVETRTVCHLEREAYQAAVLAARMEEGGLDAAPVWSDILTFDAGAWSGAVDCVVAGFPCQDLSLAGRRAGLDGKRSGLFFNILDIAHACGARFLFLENVAGIASATASTVDEESASEYVGNYHAKGFSQVGVEDGRLLERAAARVLGELADRGWNAEWLTLSASDVGASHGRERWFCWAWRELGDAASVSSDIQHGTAMQRGWSGDAEQAGMGCRDLGHADKQRQQQPHDKDCAESWHQSRTGSCGTSGELGHTQSQRRGEARQRDAAPRPAGTCWAGAGMADTEGHGRHQGRAEPVRQQGRSDATECGGAVADTSCERRQQIARSASCDEGSDEGRSTADHHIAASACPAVAHASSPRQQGREQCGTCPDHRGGSQTHGPTEQLRRPFFAPGPNDARWPAIVREWPGLAPALDKTAQSGLRRVADGLAGGMDDCRAQRLKCVGNGVVALCAAAAVVQLVRRMKESPC